MTRLFRWPLPRGKPRLAIVAAFVGLVVQLVPPDTATAEPLTSCSDQGWAGVWAAALDDPACS